MLILLPSNIIILKVILIIIIYNYMAR